MAYSAFISYSHSADDRFADALQRALHRFAKPWYRLRALRVFRDQTNLSANPALWPSIEEALRESAFFLLLASRRAASSKWVNKEVEFWKSQRPAQTLLLILTDGELYWDAEARDFDWTRTTAIPRCLESYYSEEPLWVDFRDDKSQGEWSLRSASFRTRVADLAAPIHGKNKDELDSDDLREHRRTIRVASLAVTGLAILFIAALVGGFIANEQRKLKDRQRRIAVTRLLAAESAATLAPNMESRDRSAILALESMRQLERMGMRSLEADQALRSALTILGHQRFAFSVGRPVGDVVFGRDRETLTAASVYGGPRQWHLGTQKPVPTSASERRVRHVALGADGSHLAMADYHPSGLEVWVEPVEASASSAARKYLGQLPVAVSPEGRYLVLGSVDRSDTQLIDLNSGETVQRLPAAQQVAFSRDGQYVAAALVRSTGVWRLDSGGFPTSLPPVSLDRAPPGAFAFSADSRYLAIRERDEDEVLVIDLRTGQEVARLPAMRDPGKSMALSTGGRYLAMARVNDVIVQDVPTGASVLLPFGAEITKLAFDPNSFRLAAAGLTGVNNNEVIGWEISGLVAHRAIPHAGTIVAMYVNESAGAVTVVSSELPGDESAFTLRQYGLGDASLAGRDVARGRGRVVMSSNGRVIAASVDGRIKVWTVGDGREETSTGHSIAGSLLAVTDDGRHVAVRDPKGVRVWDRTSGATVTEVPTEASEIAVTLGPTAWYMVGTTPRKIGEGTRGSRVEISRNVVDLRQRREVADLVFKGRPLPALFIDPTAAFVAQASTVIENVATGARESASGILRPIVRVPDHSNFAYTGTFIVFSPNGRYFATRADDGRLKVWDQVSRREISRLPRGPSSGTAALGDDARYLAVFGDGVIQVWLLSPLDLRREGCELMALKDLGPVMWSQFWDSDQYEQTCER